MKYSIKQNYLIITILFLAFTIRVWGVYFDFPGTRYIHDETYHISYIVKALSEQTIFPDAILQYPLLLTVVYFPLVVLKIFFIALREGLFSAADIKAYMIINGMGQLIVLTRWVSVFFGTAGVYLVYRITGLVFRSRLAAYFSALAYSFSLVPVFLSHWGRAHSAMMFFILLSLFFALLFEKRKEHRWFYYSVAASALAVSTHYLGINAFIFPFLALIYNRDAFKPRVIGKAILLFTVIVSFFYLLNFPGIKWMILANLGYYENSGTGSLLPVGPWERFYYLIRDTFFVAPAFTALALFWLVRVRGVYNDRLQSYLLWAVVYNYLIMISIVAAPANARWLLVFITYNVILVSGTLVVWLQDKINQRNLLAVILSFILLPGLLLSFKYSWLLNHNTRVQARDWLIKNAADKRIYSFDYIIELPLSVRAAQWQVQENNIKSAKNRYVIDHPDAFAGQGVDMFYDYFNYRYRDLAGDDISLIVISYESPEEKKQLLDNLENHHELELVKNFYPYSDGNISFTKIINNPILLIKDFSVSRSGPYVEIYKTKN